MDLNLVTHPSSLYHTRFGLHCSVAMVECLSFSSKKSYVGCRLSLRCNYCPIPLPNPVVGFASTLCNTSKFLNVSCLFIIDEFATLLALQCILNSAALIVPQEADHRSQIMCACVLVVAISQMSKLFHKEAVRLQGFVLTKQEHARLYLFNPLICL